MTKIKKLEFKLNEEKKKTKYLKKEIKKEQKRCQKIAEEYSWLKNDWMKLYDEEVATDYFIGEIREFLGINERPEKEHPSSLAIEALREKRKLFINRDNLR